MIGSRRTELPPILLEIVEGALESARREMELQVDRTARSITVREQHDHRAGIFDQRGRSVTALSFASTPTPIIKKFEGRIHEGDVFIFNDCYKSDGGITHLPDICITVPVFSAHDTIVAYVQVFGHVMDIGGKVPSSMSADAVTIFEEGLMVPPVKLLDQGVRNEALYETILNNSRLPDALRGDIDAFINACKLGANRVEEICERYGSEALFACFEHLLERCARDLREVVLPQIPDGSFAFEDFTEYDGVQALEPRKYIRLKVTMHKSRDKVVFDFTGTDSQINGSMNWPGSPTYYAKYMGSLLKSFAPDMVVNDGVNRVCECVLPAGTVLSPRFPAACGWRSYTLLRLLDVGLGVLGKATGGTIPASAETIGSYGFYGHDEEGKFFLHWEIAGAGSGARPFADGDDTVDLAPESKNMPSEFAESFYPVRMLRQAVRPDSGGAGEYRGGMGYFKDILILQDGALLLQTDRAILQPWGVNGGLAGATSTRILNPGTEQERVLPGKSDFTPVKAGDVLRVLTPGGGGWGDPLARDTEAVRLDVVRRLVSRENAFRDYGAVFVEDADGVVSIDENATAAERARRCRDRGPLRRFDRGPAFAALEAAGEISLTSEDGYL